MKVRKRSKVPAKSPAKGRIILIRDRAHFDKIQAIDGRLILISFVKVRLLCVVTYEAAK